MCTFLILVLCFPAVTATPAHSDSDLPVVDLEYVVQRATTFNVGFLCSELPVILLLTSVALCSIQVASTISQISVTLSHPLRSFASKLLEAPRQIALSNPEQTATSVIKQSQTGSIQPPP